MPKILIETSEAYITNNSASEISLQLLKLAERRRRSLIRLRKLEAKMKELELQLTELNHTDSIENNLDTK